jgi:lysophospholipase L1-like esterase
MIKIRTYIFLTIALLILSQVCFQYVEANQVVIDNSPTQEVLLSRKPTVVFTSNVKGYIFYTNTTGSCVYKKTVDGGNSWREAVDIDGSNAGCLNPVIWYDQWTPGDDVGTFVHILWADSNSNDLFYQVLNTATDQLVYPTPIRITNLSATHLLNDDSDYSLTKSTDGKLYVALNENNGSRILRCPFSGNTAQCDAAAKWSALSNVLDSVVNDQILLMPLAGGNILLTRWDWSENDLDSIIYNASNNLWQSWTKIDTNAQNGNGPYRHAWGLTVDKTNNDIYLCYVNSAYTNTADVRTALYSNGLWTRKADVATDRKTVQCSIAMDQNNNNVLVNVIDQPGSDDSRLVKSFRSTNKMQSWTSPTIISDENGDFRSLSTDIMNSSVIYSVYSDHNNANFLASKQIVIPGGDNTCRSETLNAAGILTRRVITNCTTGNLIKDNQYVVSSNRSFPLNFKAYTTTPSGMTMLLREEQFEVVNGKSRRTKVIHYGIKNDQVVLKIITNYSGGLIASFNYVNNQTATGPNLVFYFRDDEHLRLSVRYFPNNQIYSVVQYDDKGEVQSYADQSGILVPLDNNIAANVLPSPHICPRNDAINVEVQSRQNNVDMVFFGDSITDWWGPVGQPVWNQYYVPRKALNAGIFGEGVQKLIWRFDDNTKGIYPKVVVINIGTNNNATYIYSPNLSSGEKTAEGIAAFVAKVQARLPEAKILLLGIFPSNLEDRIPRNLKTNEIIQNLNDGEKIHYMDISQAFLNPDGTLNYSCFIDGVHPNVTGYSAWAAAIEKKVIELMGEAQ